jgi:hypothetical protein
MPDVGADTRAQPRPDGAVSPATDGESLLLDASIDSRASHDRERDVETGLDYFGESALLGAGIEFWADDVKKNVIDSY